MSVSTIFFKKNVTDKTFQNTFTAMKIVKIILTIIAVGFFMYFYILFKGYENREPSINTSSVEGPISL